MSGRFTITAIVACALVTAPATALGAVPWLVAPPAAPPADSEPPQDTEWGEEDELPPTVAPTPTSPPVAAPPRPTPPTPEMLELRERQRTANRMVVAGSIILAVADLVCVAGVPFYISGRIEENKKETFFHEAGDPESARRKQRIGGTLMLSGLGIASVGGALLIVGLVKKKRHVRELDALVNAKPTAAFTPWLGPGGGGLALQGRF